MKSGIGVILSASEGSRPMPLKALRVSFGTLGRVLRWRCYEKES